MTLKRTLERRFIAQRLLCTFDGISCFETPQKKKKKMISSKYKTMT